MEWIAINLGLALVLGPSWTRTQALQIVAKLLKGEIPGLPRFGYAVVDVRDLADLEVRAMTAPEAAGQRYIGSGPFISMSEIASVLVLKERLGDKAKKARKLHDWVVRFAGLFDSEVPLCASYSTRQGTATVQRKGSSAGHLGPWKTTIMDAATSLETVGALS